MNRTLIRSGRTALHRRLGVAGAVLAAAVPFAGLLATAGVVARVVAIGIDLNADASVLVGIGVAYGIYIVKRCREDREPTFYGKSTGRAVVLTALAAMAAFGSLLIGSHQGIRSLGLVTVIGISGCLTAAMILLPALVQPIQRKGWKL